MVSLRALGVLRSEDWVMIVRTYGRWIPSVDPTAGAKVTALFNRQAQEVG